MKNIKKITIFVIAISLSLQFLNADIYISDGLIWSERIFREDYFSAIFTCKVLNNSIIKEEHKDESGKVYVENGRYRITVQVEKVFLGKVDTDTVNIGSWDVMEPKKTYLIYAVQDNLQDNYFHLAGINYHNANHSKKVTNEKDLVRELEILSELSNIINNKLTCKYVMLDADHNKLAEGFFENGKRIKKWKHYWPNRGDIKTEYDFTNNSVTRYENGLKRYKNITSENKEISYQYSTENNNRLIYKSITTKKGDGKLVNWFRYYDNGKLQERYSSKLLGNDKEGYGTDVDMDFKLYYENGKIKAKGAFLNNDSVGTWCFYDEKGKFKEEKIYKDKNAFGSGPNNYFAQEGYCTLTGKIMDEENKEVIGATITLNQNGVQKGLDNFRGRGNMYKIRAYSSGTYEVEVSYRGLLCKKEIIELKTGENRTLDIQVDLSDMKSQSISGKITNKKTGENLVGAVVDIGQKDKTFIRAKTLKDGAYSVKEISTGIYSIKVRCVGGYIFENKEIEVKKDEKIKLDFQLTPISETNFYGKITGEDTDNVFWGGISLIQNETIMN